jgi:hypothetical protein
VGTVAVIRLFPIAASLGAALALALPAPRYSDNGFRINWTSSIHFAHESITYEVIGVRCSMANTDQQTAAYLKQFVSEDDARWAWWAMTGNCETSVLYRYRDGIFNDMLERYDDPSIVFELPPDPSSSSI